jgi:acetyl-CoA carboxylase biotin carboxylase subunit
VDIVREQLRVAMGQPLRVHAGTLQPRGHAIECRITAEDPFNDFLPATGIVRYLRIPGGPGVRWDGGIEAGNEVTLYYDPLIAKLIVWGETRAVALERMRRALRELTIVGIPSSQAFHLRVMDDPEFQRGDIDTTYLERAGARLLVGEVPAALARPLAVVAALLAENGRAATPAAAPSVRPPDRPSAWVLTARREAVGG